MLFWYCFGIFLCVFFVCIFCLFLLHLICSKYFWVHTCRGLFTARSAVIDCPESGLCLRVCEYISYFYSKQKTNATTTTATAFCGLSLHENLKHFVVVFVVFVRLKPASQKKKEKKMKKDLLCFFVSLGPEKFLNLLRKIIHWGLGLRFFFSGVA